uniref:Uncharacterized protein n=1 Tax=Tetradesmus obliquus TaxID=3088 RepID=A0A383WL10_TETOB|eukprot:jgi/Sobl393_1/12035/SZX71250.1
MRLPQLLVINVEDQDFRDMLFDYRITRPGIDHQHKHFVSGHYCCHLDTAVYSYSCPRPPSNFSAYWGSDSPPCPPTVQFTCPDLTSGACNKVRAAVYPAAGLDPASGHVANCSRAGRVLLRARPGSGYRLTASVHGSQLSQQLVLDPNSIDTGQVDAFMAQVAAAHSDAMFLLPSEPLGRSFRLGGALVPLQAALTDPAGDKFGEFGWPWELWPWPPSASCSDTGTPAVLRLQGSIKAHFAAFDPSKALPHFPVAFLGKALSVPQYQQQQQQQQQQQEGAAAGAVGSATSGTAAAGGDGSAMVVVSALTGINISVGLLPQLGGCQAWQLHRPGLRLEYGRELWRGTVQELAALRKPVTAGSQLVTVTLADVTEPQPLALPRYGGELYVYVAADTTAAAAAPAVAAAAAALVTVTLADVTEPQPLALPRYGGELYVYVALVLGGVWMFSTVPLIVMFGVVLINVQRNRGLPIFLYRYMRKYRGW